MIFKFISNTIFKSQTLDLQQGNVGKVTKRSIVLRCSMRDCRVGIIADELVTFLIHIGNLS